MLYDKTTQKKIYNGKEKGTFCWTLRGDEVSPKSGRWFPFVVFNPGAKIYLTTPKQWCKLSIMEASGAKVNEYRDIGQRIRLYRDQAGMSQAELSRKIGFKSPTAVFFIEQGKRRVKVLDLVAISQALGVTVDMLITGAEIVGKSQAESRLEEYETTTASVIIQGGEISATIPEFLTTEELRT